MFHLDAKFIIVAVLLVALVLAKVFSGGRPYDLPVRRRRRFGYKGSESPLNQPGGREAPLAPEPEKPPVDPEKEFFKE